jgi:hypothetical protein
MAWKGTIDEEVVRVLLALPVHESTKLLDVIRGLVGHPSQPVTFFELDASGRSLSAMTIGRHEIVFWVDHAVKEVRIVGLFSD